MRGIDDKTKGMNGSLYLSHTFWSTVKLRVFRAEHPMILGLMIDSWTSELFLTIAEKLDETGLDLEKHVMIG